MKTRLTTRSFRFFAIYFLCQIFSGMPLFAADINGRIVGITDGDSVTVVDGRLQQHRVRLYGIDCPERGQAYGNAAKKYLTSLVAGKNVFVKKMDTDRYGRLVGVVSMEGKNINRKMIESGYAWLFRRYCKASFCSDWLKLERQAKDAGRGLWQEKEPVPPWKWRRRK